MSAERLAEFSKRVAKEKRRLSILLLGPGQPSQAKRVYRDEVRADLRRSYKTEMMEDFRMNIPLDDKFSKLISGRNLIAAVFVRRGSREGLCWELGFLEGFARGKDQETGQVSRVVLTAALCCSLGSGRCCQGDYSHGD
jgi:hypothetical protein